VPNQTGGGDVRGGVGHELEVVKISDPRRSPGWAEQKEIHGIERPSIAFSPYRLTVNFNREQRRGGINEELMPSWRPRKSRLTQVAARKVDTTIPIRPLDAAHISQSLVPGSDAHVITVTTSSSGVVHVDGKPAKYRS